MSTVSELFELARSGVTVGFNGLPIVQESTHSVKQPRFDPYRNSFLTNEDQIPIFADSIFVDPYIPAEEKTKFLNEFLYKYMTDRKFRKNVTGKYIVFLTIGIMGMLI
jgi:hypothetical protein